MTQFERSEHFGLFFSLCHFICHHDHISCRQWKELANAVTMEIVSAAHVTTHRHFKPSISLLLSSFLWLPLASFSWGCFVLQLEREMMWLQPFYKTTAAIHMSMRKVLAYMICAIVVVCYGASDTFANNVSTVSGWQHYDARSTSLHGCPDGRNWRGVSYVRFNRWAVRQYDVYCNDHNIAVCVNAVTVGSLSKTAFFLIMQSVVRMMFSQVVARISALVFTHGPTLLPPVLRLISSHTSSYSSLIIFPNVALSSNEFSSNVVQALARMRLIFLSSTRLYAAVRDKVSSSMRPWWRPKVDGLHLLTWQLLH